MSDDIRAKAQAVLDVERDLMAAIAGPARRQSVVVEMMSEYRQAVEDNAPDLARHVLTLEARLELALTGCMQTNEWLLSESEGGGAWVADDALDRFEIGPHQWSAARAVVAALVAAMPGSDL